jgi:uncharacterized protein YbcI
VASDRGSEGRLLTNPPAANKSPAADISTGAVQLLREYTGRGPTKARTTIGNDTVTIVVADALTQGERSLVEHGFEESVLSTRAEYQRAMREDLIGLVEENTERKVIAFMSDNHVDPDYGVEVFVLEPAVAGQ